MCAKKIWCDPMSFHYSTVQVFFLFLLWFLCYILSTFPSLLFSSFLFLFLSSLTASAILFIFLHQTQKCQGNELDLQSIWNIYLFKWDDNYHQKINFLFKNKLIFITFIRVKKYCFIRMNVNTRELKMGDYYRSYE